MIDADDRAIVVSHGNNLTDLFPGYYSPTEKERRDAYRQGLVSIDANGLLDLYRFSKRARNEFFEILEKLRPRLFITHQAALEFHRNRLTVVESRLSAVEEKCKEIETPLRSLVQKLQEFAKRYQIGDDEQQRLIGLVSELSSTLADSIKAYGAYDLAREEVRAADDAVLRRLETLLAGRVGDALDEAEYKNAIKEAGRRIEERIPPGYSDKEKDSPEKKAGDYLVWRQLMNEAMLHERPVLLIINEQKDDWVLKGSAKQVLGPRPELVLEMRREAKVALHMVTVVGILKEAPEYLGTAVSPSTIREAESLPKKPGVGIQFSPAASFQYDKLSASYQDAVTSTFELAANRLEQGQPIEDWPDVSMDQLKKGIHFIRWSLDRSAVFQLTRDSSSDLGVAIFIMDLDEEDFLLKMENNSYFIHDK